MKQEGGAEMTSESETTGVAEADAKVDGQRAMLARLHELDEMERELVGARDGLNARLGRVLNQLDSVRMERSRLIEGRVKGG